VRGHAAASASATEGAQSFWNDHQPGFRFARSEVGTRAFFDEVEAARYELEPHIPEIVRFDRWSGCDVLEAGCGIATDGIRFARAAARYTGTDLSPQALDLARRRFALEGIDGIFLPAPVTALSFEAESFDLVYSHGVIHHVADTAGAVAEFFRVLRPGGTALVMVYHHASFNYWVTIMGLRRLLAASLVVPGAVEVVARVTGESRDVLDGHRRLLHEHGLRYLSDRDLFLSSNTDGPGNPLSKVYTRSDARRLFVAFEEVDFEVRHLNLRIYPGGARIARTAFARRLERRFGWHLYIEARKGT
jgi:SAM-dependent methyltransferase